MEAGSGGYELSSFVRSFVVVLLAAWRYTFDDIFFYWIMKYFKKTLKYY